MKEREDVAEVGLDRGAQPDDPADGLREAQSGLAGPTEQGTNAAIPPCVLGKKCDNCGNCY